MAAGSWEQKAGNQVLCAIPHVETVSIAWSMGFRNLQIPGQVIGLAGMPFDHSRNTACFQALAGGFSHVFFLDSDVIPPSDAVLRLLSHGLPLVSGVYYRRSPPHGIPVLIKGGKWVTNPPVNALFDVDYAGAGCLLIHRSILENLKPLDERRGKRWFDWRVDMAHSLPPGEALSEDFAFCLEVRRQLGIPMMIDTSIQCRHIGLAQATMGQMTPAEATPHT